MSQIKKNENYVMEITGMSHEGQGVGRIDNFTVFVDRALQGEVAEVKIIKVNKSYGIGKLINIQTASPERIEPFCVHSARCGGCSLQHMSYEAQLKFKTNVVKESLKRLGRLEDIMVRDTIGMQDNGTGYRNKAQYPVGMAGDGVSMGFYASRSHDIIDGNLCGIQHPYSDRVRECVRKFMVDSGVRGYDEGTGNGLIRHIVTRIGYRTDEVMAVIVINGERLPARDKLIQMLISEMPQVKSIYLNINTANTNIIFGNRSMKIYGKDTITDYIGKFRFEISPLSFFQVNPVQTEVLYSKALEYSGLTGSETVFDLYCGIGTISLFLSQRAKRVYGVEVVEAAIVDARLNAKINEVDNVEFIAGEAEKVIPHMYREGIRADVVVIDPPRKGCDEVLLKTLVDMEPKRIVYVSCNPATLARDVRYLADNGYRAEEVQPVDMFPWTGHVECVVRIQRIN
ncbi:23S rRNA m(5)U-1939 methyltransferase [Anaerobacterium chartisolvens]|uniref:23S rRNA m(5)U-1939 methyltransferase n=1 Tax=Anaerobacterium chartisolvens TaxID=1297424 RepID=A0A369B7F3_9FIRM|nr:23S rRNA (uracil(1939)-C(5))-methyltransferase RlmD [Anaerobacterium chartisolvens]RCX17459.1 23S rRNA m(5)U-1939 methyltransferase [Anaerobacterium chartisolvens]